MKHLFLKTFLFVLVLAGTLSAGEVKIIEFTDGSVVTGEVVSLTNGRYTIRTDALGTLTVPDSKIAAIRARDAAGSPAAGAASINADEIKSLTDKMMADQDIMSMIQSLKDDPEFMSILQDKDIMTAVENGDAAALMANPKFLNLMNNAAVRNIQKKVSP